MPTVILVDVSLSMTRPVPLSENHEISRKQLAIQGINAFLDNLSVHSKLEFIALVKKSYARNMGTSIDVVNPCTTVAIRYQFVYSVIDGNPNVLFVPQCVIKCVFDTSREATPGETESLKDKDVVYEDDVNYLRSLDPKEWKKQDHYRVLGIKNLRFEASDEVIKTAYRKMVLKHHPDKRKAMGEEIRPDDDYFTCITMAYETLGTPNKRKAYDSVDPEFDNSLPSGSDLKKDFFEVFGYYFDINSRWSEKSNIPKLGEPDTPREKVERFYNFWYEFKSWREYSYEDEEDKDKCADRDERRMCEKINKAERQRKKKEEMSRIRNLVDLAYNADPRIASFKLEEKERKLAAKRAKQTAAQAKKEEEARMLKEAQLAKEQAEAAERARLEAKRQERELQKKALKKERKTFRDVCKTNSYYATNDEENLLHLQSVDKICEIFNLMKLEELNKKLQGNGRNAFLEAIRECETQIESERKNVLESIAQKTYDHVKNMKNGCVKIKAEWSQDNIQLLIKAVNLFPAGTNQRWEVVANFINQHGSFPENCNKFNAKDVLAKAKDLQKTDFSKNDLKDVANQQAFNNFEKEKRTIQVVSNPEITTKVNENSSEKDIPWTATEQQLLEQALKTYPTSSTPDRWDRIAECIPNRSKKDCIKRYKELAQIVKAKKAAQVAVNSK